MKRILLLILCFSGLGSALAQAPQITGDLMLCPDTNGTAVVTNPIYDSYQWYSKYWFTPDDYVAIDGATDSSFTYDWYTYDQSLFKVVVTLGSETFESNVIQIDSYAWAGFTVGTELNENVTIDPNNGNLLLCSGGSFTASIFMPYDHGIQWFKNGDPISGANSMDYLITGPGTFHVTAAPGFCPNSTSSNEFMPIVVEEDANCTLSSGTPGLSGGNIKIHPNPATEALTLELPQNTFFSSYSVVDATGKEYVKDGMAQGQRTATINVSGLASGTYFLQLHNGRNTIVKRFIKN